MIHKQTMRKKITSKPQCVITVSVAGFELWRIEFHSLPQAFVKKG